MADQRLDEPDAAVAEGRRARLRRQTLQDLHAAAMAEIREHGAVELSLRRVARRLGMSPAGLYRYVDSREDLLTRLIADAYHDLADHLLVAIGADDERQDLQGPPPVPPTVATRDADVCERVRAAALAYRDWGVRHPNEFGLLFGNPIPNYEAPPGGPTVAAMGRVGFGLGRPLVEAWEQGRLRVPDGWRALVAEPHLAARFDPMLDFDGRRLTPEVAATLLLLWGRLHGQVSLEVFGHHHWLLPDGCEALYVAELEAIETELFSAPDGS
ncbi:TetR/AcrR family transcriptional regulator [Egicoccus sp. AB-alg2]|uniref:TetR/AcrR family transcriptional regulator n=1 Tax=Egicoccus sp. AB-alg2 TaxID=3242693 RepID=UPI00359D42CE